MDRYFHDARYAFRTLARSPGFAVVSTLTLAIGIGANTAIFSVVNAVLIRPLPYPSADQIVTVRQFFQPTSNETSPVSAPEFLDYQRDNRTLKGIAAFTTVDVTLSAIDEPMRLRAAVTTPSFFAVMGVSPMVGRVFTEDEGQPGAGLVALISHALWRSHLGGGDVIGTPLVVNGRPRAIVGIMPPDFRFPARTDVWLPLAFTPEQLTPVARANHMFEVVGRVADHSTAHQAQEDLRRIAKDFPGGWIRVSALPLREDLVGDVRPALYLLTVAVGLVLLIACANVAHLLLARGATRHAEIATRVALGASPRRLLEQLAVEGFVLSAIACVIGLLLAQATIGTLVAIAPAELPRVGDIRLDGTVLTFALVIASAVGLLCGITPLRIVRQRNLQSTIRESTAPTGRMLQGGLLATEMALTTVLLIGATLVLRSFGRVVSEEAGFQADRVLTAQVSLPAARYTAGPQRLAFFEQLLERVRALPDIEAVGGITALPLGGTSADRSFVHDGMKGDVSNNPPGADYRQAFPGYFEAMGIDLRQGRFFGAQDNQVSLPVAIINETLANRLWPNQDPLQHRLRFFARSGGFDNWLTVIGVVADVRHHGLDRPAHSEIYVSALQSPTSSATLVVRSRGEPSLLIPSIRGQVKALDKDLPLYNVTTMKQLVATSVARRRFSAQLLGTFGAVALLLAVVGVYGVMSYGVARRTREIGIRAVLGAARIDVFRLVIGQAMSVTLLGVAAGVAASVASMRLLAAFLYNTSPMDVATFLGVPALLLIVAVLGSYLPARTALGVEPLIALRRE